MEVSGERFAAGVVLVTFRYLDAFNSNNSGNGAELKKQSSRAAALVIPTSNICSPFASKENFVIIIGLCLSDFLPDPALAEALASHVAHAVAPETESAPRATRRSTFAEFQ